MRRRSIQDLALASLSGESNAFWALRREPWIDHAFLGGLAVDESTRNAAENMVQRGRDEFLPDDPVAWIHSQFRLLENSTITPAINVRASSPSSIPRVAAAVSQYDGILELNAHCRQPEMVESGCGHALLRDPQRLWDQLDAALEAGVTVSVKARFEVDGAETVDVLNNARSRGCDVLHVDTMDSTERLQYLTGKTIIGNNGVRQPEDLKKMARFGADTVSIARGDSPGVLRELHGYILSDEKNVPNPDYS